MAAPTASITPVSAADHPGGPATSGHFLAIAGPNTHMAYPLPREGTITIGRAEDADLRIPDPGISRFHVRFQVRDGFSVEDLGSHNGTFVRDARIEANLPVPIFPGEVLGLGSTMITIQQRLSALTTGHLGTHAQLEACLIEECAGAETLGRSFALVRLDLAPETDAAAVETALLSLLRPGDRCALYAPLRYEILLVDTERTAAELLVRKLGDRLRELADAQLGVAYCPDDGRSPGEVFAKACAAARHQPGASAADQDTIVVSQVMRELYQTAQRAAQGTIAILISGETGVGKELLAAAVHRASPRAARPFMSINCAALAESVLESELFGHERGAFTGANTAKEGLFEAASGGTLFLDEVGEMTPGMQAKLLRVLEKQEIQRVGATRPKAVDVRVLSATNRDLEEAIEAGQFRRDLFYRLNGISLVLPPLRQRTEEIEPIARLVVEKTARQVGRSAPEIDAEVVTMLQRYPWPGNVRELRNMMERAVLLCAGSRITLDHLPTEKMRFSIGCEQSALLARPVHDGEEKPAWWSRRAELEKSAMADALTRCNGNRTRAAELLGMPRSTFMRKMAENGLLDRRR